MGYIFYATPWNTSAFHPNPDQTADMPLIIDLIRHGQPEGGRKFRGNRVDDPLTERGWQQMREGVGSFTGWDCVYSSPLQRCRAFAEDYCNKNNKKYEIIENLKEVGFGRWEGMTPDQVQATYPEEWQQFYANPVAHPPQGAEPVADLVARVGAVLDELQQRHSDTHLLVVAHAGVIRAAITYTLGQPLERMYDLKIDLGRLTRLSLEPGRRQLLGMNQSAN
jgi:broad specificity phosphatase PhoE